MYTCICMCILFYLYLSIYLHILFVLFLWRILTNAVPNSNSNYIWLTPPCSIQPCFTEPFTVIPSSFLMISLEKDMICNSG